MVVKLDLDSKDLAHTYDLESNMQFEDGCMLLDQLDLKPEDEVLDIGCGTGRLSRYAAEQLGHVGRFLGMDPLEERVKLAQEKNVHPNALYRIGIAEDLGFVPDNSMDLAYMNWVFHWVVDKQVALYEISRVLKPGGKIGLVMAPKELSHLSSINLACDRVLKRDPYNGEVRWEESIRVKQGLLTSELIKLMLNAGLNIKEIEIKNVQRMFETPKQIIDCFVSGAFGNYLNHVPETLREQAKIDIEAELAKNQTKEGVLFSSYRILAIAQK